MWWGGFLLSGFLLILVSLPFFSFPKVLSAEKEKIRYMEKTAASTSIATTASGTTTTVQVKTVVTKNDSGYGKDIKGFYNFILEIIEALIRFF